MTQPKRKKDERAELVKLFRTMLPGELVKLLEIGIQSIIETELNSILGAEHYQRVEGRTNYRNAQSKVSKTDLLWLLPLIKDLIGSRTKESFQLAWI